MLPVAVLIRGPDRGNINLGSSQNHVHSLPIATQICPKEFLNQPPEPIRNVDFCSVDMRTHPVSGSMHKILLEGSKIIN